MQYYNAQWTSDVRERLIGVVNLRENTSLSQATFCSASYRMCIKWLS